MEEEDRLFSIAGVEREVGLSKDVLRVWERRYGFPAPARDGRGERVYPVAQVRRLALIKRLMDRGHRPGRLFGLPDEQLRGLAAAPGDGGVAASLAVPGGHAELLGLVRAHDAVALVEALQRGLAQEGLQRFVLDTVALLALQVGEEWSRGALRIHEEHLFTEAVTRVLRQAVSQLPRGHGSRVLLTTLPNEPHGLGLLMVECLLALNGARCIPLGTQMPTLEITRAAEVHDAAVVALSFSAAFPARQSADAVRQLRSALPARIGLWAGGAGARPLARIEGVRVTDRLADVPLWLRDPASQEEAPGGR